jgi:SAM-dependent methyltransferase
MLLTNDPERFTGRYARQTVAALTRHIDAAELPKLTVLDYGCGSGRLAKLLAPTCKWMICADVAPNVVAECRKYLADLPNIGHLVVDGTTLEADRTVDFIYSYAAICYFNRAEDFWRTVGLIDAACEQFCLHLHNAINESPAPGRTIEGAEGEPNPFSQIECYRPSPVTIKKHYPDRRYLVEWHEPDVRGKDIFFFKRRS